MERSKLQPQNFMPPLGGYSHGYAVDVGDARFVYVAGQLALDEHGDLVSDDIEEQTRYVFDLIKRILEEGGASLDDVVKAQIFVTDISEYPKVSAIRNQYFANSKPVSTLVEVTRLVRDGCKIEVEAMAVTARP